mmetsp:Transcript_21032/g.31384  ORF Transcript_21032/g.31384 Transcript_21032/m.31384 type:complete len:519 (-) Transcript_21032:52-1608(-)
MATGTCPECNAIMTIVDGHKCEKCGIPTCAICCSLKRSLENRYICASCFEEKPTNNNSTNSDAVTSPPPVQRKTSKTVFSSKAGGKLWVVRESHLQIQTASEEEKQVRMKLIGITMDDLVIGEVETKDTDCTGEPIMVRGVVTFKTKPEHTSVNDTPAKTMKLIASAFGIVGYGSMSKVKIAQALVSKIEAHRNFCEANSAMDFTRTKNDVFLFMNIILSDVYIERLKDIGLSSRRDQLDIAKQLREKTLFWHNISSAMTTAVNNPDEDICDFLVLAHDPNEHVTDEMYDLAASNPNFKDPRNDLQNLYKSLRKKWTEARERYTQSGSHDHNFYSFCKGDRTIYYFDLLLNGKGLDVLEAVKTSLPDNVKLSSTTPPRTSSNQSRSSSGSKRKSDDLINNICSILEKKDAREQQKHDIEMRKQTEDTVSSDGQKRMQLISTIRDMTNAAVENEKHITELEKDLPNLISESENETPLETMKRRLIERKYKTLENLLQVSEDYNREIESMQSQLRALSED